MSDLVDLMRKGAAAVDRHRFPMIYKTYMDGASEIERLRRDKERALAALRYAARAKYDEDAVRYAAEIAIEEITR